MLNQYLKALNSKVMVKFDHKVGRITKILSRVKKGSIYVLAENLSNSQILIDEAINKGASTVILPSNIELEENGQINYLKVLAPLSLYQGLLALKYHNFKRPIIIGITGTCGKTTVSTILYNVFKQMNKKTCLLSSNGIFLNTKDKELYFESPNTTPALEMVYHYLYDYTTFDYAVIEVSSQGLSHGRLEGIYFDVCAFLNLSKEHLDFHYTMNDYKKAKGELFKKLKPNGKMIVNIDSEYALYYLNIGACKKYTFGKTKANYNFKIIEDNQKRLLLQINKDTFESKTVGTYNAYNITCVYGILKMLNIPIKYLRTVLLKPNLINGRMEIHYIKERYLVIDYAHTQEEVKAALSFLNRNKKRRLLLVIGCGGNRDTTKRPDIGRSATLLADWVCFTEDNSRNENTMDIINQMIEGTVLDNYSVEPNRKLAIAKIIRYSKKGDTIAILGKGAESYITTKNSKEEFNDYLVASKLMEELLHGK